jgi:hypothetical protein
MLLLTVERQQFASGLQVFLQSLGHRHHRAIGVRQSVAIKLEQAEIASHPFFGASIGPTHRLKPLVPFPTQCDQPSWLGIALREKPFKIGSTKSDLG